MIAGPGDWKVMYACPNSQGQARCTGSEAEAMRPHRASAFADATPVDGRGRRSPGDVLARAVRDHLLRIAADRFCAGMSDRAAAKHLHTKLSRYRAGAWRRDRSEALCPARHRGTVNELMWLVLKIRDAIPGDRMIRAALALEPFSIAHDP